MNNNKDKALNKRVGLLTKEQKAKVFSDAPGRTTVMGEYKGKKVRMVRSECIERIIN